MHILSILKNFAVVSFLHFYCGKHIFSVSKKWAKCYNFVIFFMELIMTSGLHDIRAFYSSSANALGGRFVLFLLRTYERVTLNSIHLPQNEFT